MEKEVCGLCHGKFEIIKNDPKLSKDAQKKKKADEISNLFDHIRNGSEPTLSNNQNEVAQTPRRLNKFAEYVKENYNSVKRDNHLSSHKDVMQELSKNFKQLSTK